MSKRLVKVAKELNVGTGSIVDFLAKKGFEIDNRPTARVSEEMYNLLVQEIQSSMALKEQADKMFIEISRKIKKEGKTRKKKKKRRSRDRLFRNRPPLGRRKRNRRKKSKSQKR